MLTVFISALVFGLVYIVVLRSYSYSVSPHVCSMFAYAEHFYYILEMDVRVDDGRLIWFVTERCGQVPSMIRFWCLEGFVFTSKLGTTRLFFAVCLLLSILDPSLATLTSDTSRPHGY